MSARVLQRPRASLISNSAMASGVAFGGSFAIFSKFMTPVDVCRNAEALDFPI